eukprot:IDg16353t1
MQRLFLPFPTFLLASHKPQRAAVPLGDGHNHQQTPPREGAEIAKRPILCSSRPQMQTDALPLNGSFATLTGEIMVANRRQYVCGSYTKGDRNSGANASGGQLLILA